MGVLFHWFKNIEVTIMPCGRTFSIVSIIYNNGGDVSHTYSNRTRLKNLFYDECKIHIPTIDDEMVHDKAHDFELIDPKTIVKCCDKILNNEVYKNHDLRERVEWIKQLSLQGYYIAYDAY